MAKVSIIIPVYKVEKYFDRCVKSVLNQTLKEIEVVLVDDGSPDNCPEMCDEYAKNDARIKVIHKKNQGLSMARNSGLAIATGEYVAFVDSDDYILPDMYEKLYQKAESYKVDAVVCGHLRDECGRVSKGHIDGMPNCETVIDYKSEYLPKVIGSLPNEDNNQSFGYSVWNAIYRHDVIKNNNISFVSERKIVSEDIFFQIDFAAHADRLLLYPKEYYVYCCNSGSLTQQYDATRFDRRVALYNEMCSRVKSYGLPIPQMELRLNRIMLFESLFSVNESVEDASYSNSLLRLRQIVNNEVLQGVLSTYPICEMSLHNRVFYTLLKQKNIRLIWFLFKLRKLTC